MATTALDVIGLFEGRWRVVERSVRGYGERWAVGDSRVLAVYGRGGVSHDLIFSTERCWGDQLWIDHEQLTDSQEHGLRSLLADVRGVDDAESLARTQLVYGLRADRITPEVADQLVEILLD